MKTISLSRLIKNYSGNPSMNDYFIFPLIIAVWTFLLEFLQWVYQEFFFLNFKWTFQYYLLDFLSEFIKKVMECLSLNSLEWFKARIPLRIPLSIPSESIPVHAFITLLQRFFYQFSQDDFFSRQHFTIICLDPIVINNSGVCLHTLYIFFLVSFWRIFYQIFMNPLQYCYGFW